MATDTRGYAITIANQVLGGASDSRLCTILREQKGWTYGAYSGVDRRRGLGSFRATENRASSVRSGAACRYLLARPRRDVGTPP